MSTRPTALPPPGSADVLYLIDLSGYIFRAYHALAPLASPRGEPTHATFGTVNMLQKLVDERKPVYLGIAADAPGPRLRTEIDARYKAHRPPPPEDLIVQIKRCHELVAAYNIPVFQAEGLEADDLMAVAVARAKEKNLRVVIASSDKDLMQLVEGERVVLWDAMRDKVYGEPEVIAKFDVPPSQLRDLLALVGDTSDNVPGVPGVGLKTAAELLHEFGSMDGVYQNLDKIKKQKIRESLEKNVDDAKISRELVTLHTEVPVTLDLETLRYGAADIERLRSLFAELGFSRLLKSLPAAEIKAVSMSASREVILDEAALAAYAAAIKDAGRVAIGVFGSSPEAMRAAIAGIALAVSPDRAVYVPVSHHYLGAPPQLSIATIARVLGPALADRSIAKVGHDTKYATVVLAQHGITLAGVTMDTMLASYLLNPEAANDIETLADRELHVRLPDLAPSGPKKRGQAPVALDQIDVAEGSAYASRRIEAALRVSDEEQKKLEQDKIIGLLTDMELPLAKLLAEMEQTGVLVDLDALAGLGKEMTKELAAIEERARAVAGQEVNLASPKQLEHLLFDVLGLKPTKKTKTGRSTDAEVLEALEDQHALPGVVLEHRAIAKLKGTYVDALPKLVHPKTGRIHTRWSQAVAATGRISSQDPNLQNIPIRTDLGMMIRRAFVAPKDCVLVSADYSQIELRVLAHLSNDPVLVSAFQNNEDVHVRTAMEIFGVPKEGVTKVMRGQAKTVNFGVIYGMGETALAKRLDIPRTQAAKFIDAYFERYQGVRAFLDKTMAEAQKSEVVHTLFGRRRVVSDLRNTDRMRRAQAERIAQNTPIQGTAADLLKLAMVHLQEPVVKGARMVLTVHDELVFEVPEALANEAAQRVRDVMEKVHPFNVPLAVDVGSGKSWADAK